MTLTEQPLAAQKPNASAWGRALAWLAIIVGLIAAFGQNFVEMWARWFPAWHRSGLSLYERFVRGESYYTHGPLVPLVSLLIVFLLIRYTRVPVRPRRGLGFTVLALSLFVHLLSCLARVNFASVFALIGVLAGIVLIFWGTTALRRFWFPLAFLVFMVPLPEVSIAQMNFRLKMVAADWGVRLVNLTGIIAERAGNRVFLEDDKSLIIANVCNGLRTLITVIGFGALYAYVCRLPGVWRIVLFAMSVPVALAANSIRIVGLIVVAHFWDEKVATGWFHDVSGAFIFVFAFMMMFGVEKLIFWARGLFGRRDTVEQLFKDVRRGPEDEHQASWLLRAAALPRVWGVAVLVVLSAAGAIWLNRSVPSTWTQDMAKKVLPEALTIDGEEWKSYDIELDQDTLTVLETTDYLCRRYIRKGAPYVEFSVIFSKDNRKGTHPPDLCLQGAGEGIVAKSPFLLTGVEGRGDIECSELILQTGSSKMCFVYVYKCGDAYTPSFWTQQFVILWNGLTNRNASGALIRVSTPIVGGDAKEARQRIGKFLQVSVPYLDKGLR